MRPIIARASPTDEERAALDGLLGPSDGPDGASGVPRQRRRHLLLPGLHALNDRVAWISPGGLAELGARLGVAQADAYGVASFYALFSLEPRPHRTTHHCTDLACLIHPDYSAQVGPGAPNRAESSCLGLCERAPAALVTEAGEHPRAWALGPERPPVAAVPQAGDPGLVLLRRVGLVDPARVDDYRAHGGYQALARAFELGPAATVGAVSASGLAGRGGAAFPTGRKWAAVAAQPGPRELVCNADESEPGTFKDRVLLEGDPFAVIEAMTVAAFATGCQRGWIYLRGEYAQARATLGAALADARRHGLLGPDIAGSGFDFDMTVFRGAGAYICGEETALFNSIEGHRGEPRNKPPYPTESGLFGRPTLVNNVETLANVAPILLGQDPAEATRLFSVSGCVERPGVYEVPVGTTLRRLLDIAGGVAGGVAGGRTLQAVLLGGAAGTFVPPDDLDVPLAVSGAAAAIVLDDRVALDTVLLRIAAFFRDESCGQCVPCRVGTVRQEEALVRLVERRPLGSAADELARLADVGTAMRDASICGLGQTAASAIGSAVARLGALAK